MSKVFICYSHKDKKYFDLVNKHISINKKNINIWSDKEIKGGDKWRVEIQKALDSCNLAVLILSVNFFNSDFIQEVELEQLLENEFNKGTKLLPVLLEDCDVEAFSWIKTTQILPSRDEPLENLKNKPLKTKLKEISQRVRKLLSSVPDDSNTKSNVRSKNYPVKIEENNFPMSNDYFFGREKYFDILDNAWDDEQVNILSFIAFGGIGKTSLIDNWLKRMKESHYKGAKNIFLWSFYSQGSEEDRQVTATDFLLEACKFFKIKKIPKTAYDQGRELADVISKKRVLLVLDGLEPLQSSFEDIGEIKDNGLQVLLKRLSRQNKGLVIITSRIKLSSIDNQYEELEKLEDSEGADLLKWFELNGSIEELKKISNDFDGHALALKLLGSYIKVVLDKDISRIDEIESLTDDKTKSSQHAIRMLNSYKKYLIDTIELDILKLLGFFDRAISFEVIEVLKNKPLINNINDKLVAVSEIDWKYALDKLKQLHLISNRNNMLDTHPLVREYFSKYIFENYKGSYIKGHYRLFKYYENLPTKRLPNTIKEMEPLFQAIHHGCLAKEFKLSYLIYYTRIHRNGNKQIASYYLTYSLGAYSIELKLLACFFEIPFKKFYDLKDKKMNSIKDVILGNIAFAMHTQGKYLRGINILNSIKRINMNNHDSIVQAAINKSEMLIEIGEFSKAEKILQDAISQKFIFKDYGIESRLLSQFAYINYILGNHKLSQEYFEKAEKSFLVSHETNGVDIKFMGSDMGYKYVEFLISKGVSLIKLKDRIEYSLFISKQANYTLDIGFHYLHLAKVFIQERKKEKEIFRIVNKAISYILKSNDYEYLVKALIFKSEVMIDYGLYSEVNEVLVELYDLIINANANKSLIYYYGLGSRLSLLRNDLDLSLHNYSN